jgi:hypothetical protein
MQNKHYYKPSYRLPINEFHEHVSIQSKYNERLLIVTSEWFSLCSELAYIIRANWTTSKPAVKIACRKVSQNPASRYIREKLLY